MAAPERETVSPQYISCAECETKTDLVDELLVQASDRFEASALLVLSIDPPLRYNSG